MLLLHYPVQRGRLIDRTALWALPISLIPALFCESLQAEPQYVIAGSVSFLGKLRTGFGKQLVAFLFLLLFEELPGFLSRPCLQRIILWCDDHFLSSLGFKILSELKKVSILTLIQDIVETALFKILPDASLCEISAAVFLYV